MLSLPPSVRIHLAAQPVDMRKGFDGLMAIVRTWGFDPFTGDLFVFVSRNRTRIKVLHWDHGGFVLTYKRLEAGSFRVPIPKPGATKLRLDSTQLAMLLDGIDFSRVRRARIWMPPQGIDTRPQV
ncbi:MAG: IS66 family insertion sequence element accessory protein TnpB [Proteobacteria bacterium]|nr:IS66 family insertion sequence element accessory protein TnpB [Pseudomonadota bacterium]MCP4894482.1 IS66 family insertion sequence element accessory protein TnpB [Actinomycetales bacterium]